MSFLKQINGVRGNVMRSMTRHIGSSGDDLNLNISTRIEIKKILICRPNHRLGNQLLITPLLQEINDTLPNAKIDLFVKGKLAPELFTNYKNIDSIIQLPRKPFKDLMNYIKGWVKIKTTHYDVVVNVVNNSSSGRIATKLANATHRFFGDIDDTIKSYYKDHEHMGKFPVYSFRSSLAKLGYPQRERPVPLLDLKLTTQEIKEGKSLLRNLLGNEKRTICIFTYATGAKCYSTVWWEEFYGKLKEKFTAYNILEILPAENVSQISFKAPTFYSKDLRQIGSVIANADVFIGADSGMMHLASAALTPTIGLFKTTQVSGYEPYNTYSMGINTNEKDIDYCIESVDKILQTTSHVPV